MIVPVAIGSILLTLFTVHDEISFYKLSPILGYNIQNTFINGLSNIFSLYFISYYFFLLPLIKNAFHFKKICVISYLISWTLLFLTVLSISAVFPIDNSSEPFNSIYLLSRKIELGDFLQRLDAIFILLWIISIFCYLSLSIFMVNHVFQKITNISNPKMLTFSSATIFLGLCTLPFDVEISRFIGNIIFRYLVIIMIFGVSFGIMILANIKYGLTKSKKSIFKIL